MAYNYSYTSSGVAFANLNTACGGGNKSPTPPNCAPQINGSMVFCKDCLQSTACTSGGSGAMAVLNQGTWSCNVGGITTATTLASVTNLTAGAGAISITGNGPTSNINNLNIGQTTPGAGTFTTLVSTSNNAVLNAGAFTGTDIGAKINNAIAALPTVTITSTAFNGTIVGTTLTVNSITAGNGGVDVGLVIAGAGVTLGTKITARGSGAGGTGTYTITPSQNVGPVAMTSTYAYPTGTVFVPSTGALQAFTTEIGGLPAGTNAVPAMTFVNLVCDKGAELQDSATANNTIWIDARDPFGFGGSSTNGAVPNVGGIYNCAFIGPASIGTGTVGLLAGNYHGYHIVGNTWTGFTAATDAAVELQNSVFSTEDTWMSQDDMFTATIALLFNENCATGTVTCTNSFEHARYQFYCGQTFGANNNYCIRATCTSGANAAACGAFPTGTGPRAQFSTWDVQYNLNGTSADSSVVSMDTSSEFLQNVGAIKGENDASHGFMFDPNAPGYYENNRMQVSCTSCADTFAGDNNNQYDQVISSGFAPLGSFGINTLLNQITLLQQGINLISIDCVNSGPGTCSVAPTVQVDNVSTAFAAVACPTSVGVNTSTTFSNGNFFTPNQKLKLDIAASPAPSACATPYFQAILHYVTF